MAENDPFCCYPHHIDCCMPLEKWSKGLDQHSETLPRNSRKGAGSTSEKPLDAKAYVQQLESSNGGTDEDPHYKFFLDHVKARGTCYVYEIPEQNICIEYPDVALTVASEAQNNVGDCSEKGR
ncbi:hypothetical protein Ahy_A07g032266 [Arachis hypogaea]|uniref:Uncharacterized protein n=1 Tax=Arachis hypogaea TaxID=3818 RepID=A0A445C6F2_ARAHY|nr:hypothetical protein Ahy_A07g032266 [Arachis hypogaea]